MKKIAVVYMAHDGFASLYSGVGTVARDFLLSFPEVSEQLEKSQPDIELCCYAVTMKYNDTSFALSHEIRNTTVSLVSSSDKMHFIELNNGSSAQDAYGTYENWKNACISASTFLHSIEDQFDRILCITVDTPFVQVANSHISTYNSSNIDFIWLPQSTVRIHKYGMSSDTTQQGKSYEDLRFGWEKGVVQLAAKDERVRLGYIGEFMRRHLISEYDASPDSLIGLTNSLNLQRLQGNVHTQKEIEEFLVKLQIPLDRPLLFSFGRAEPYKGLDLVLGNCANLIKEQNYFILIFAAPYSMDDPYIKELDSIAAKYPNDIKVIYGLDFTAPHYVMQWLNTKIVAILSRAEPFGLIPIESRFYNNPSLTLLVSNQDGLGFQIDDGLDGFTTDLSPKNIQSKLSQIAKLSEHNKRRISQNGYNKVIAHYDQKNVNLKLLEQYVSGL